MYSSINKKFENSTIYRKAANNCFSFVNMNAKIIEIQIFAKSGA